MPMPHLPVRCTQTGKTISLDAPNLGEVEKQYLNEAVDSNFVSTVKGGRKYGSSQRNCEIKH